MPEAFYDSLLVEVMPDLHYPEVVYVGGDLADGVMLDEDEAVAILANSGQVRQYLYKKALSRGFFQNKQPGGGRKPLKALTDGQKEHPPPPSPYKQFRTARRKTWTRTTLMARTVR